MMKKTLIAMIALSALAACQSIDTAQTTQPSSETNTSDNSALMSAALTTAMNVYSAQSGMSSETAVVSAIEDKLSLTPEQAIGGVGALMSVAQNTLGSEATNELETLIPGAKALESSGLAPLITNMGAVDSAFSALGIDPALASQFSPLIIEVLKSQGASTSLISGLTSVWN
jgi:hypothetical protein